MYVYICIYIRCSARCNEIVCFRPSFAMNTCLHCTARSNTTRACALSCMLHSVFASPSLLASIDNTNEQEAGRKGERKRSNVKMRGRQKHTNRVSVRAHNE